MIREQFIERMKEQRGATFATIQVLTEPSIKCPKTSGMAGRIKERSVVNGVLNHVYGNSVNYQRSREGKEADFEPLPRKWGQRIKGTTLVEHKGRYYLEMKVEKASNPQYFLDGKPVQKEDIDQYLLPKRKSKSRQGLKKETILRDFDVKNIEVVRMNREEIVLS